MTDFDRPVHDPATDPDTDTTAMPVPTATPATPAIPADTITEASTIDEVSATTAASTATEPVSAPTPSGPRRSRTRWFAAAGIVAVIVGVTAIGTLMLTGASSTSTVAGYVPADSLMYGELRLDLPGDQRQKVGQFLAKFPGFADQAALETKLDEVLDRLTSESTNGDQTYTRDIKPWFDGELGFSVGGVPTTEDPLQAAAQIRALVLLSIKNEALARTWFTDAIAGTGVSSTAQDYQGTQLTVFADPTMGDVQVAFALVGGKVAIAGDIASVKAAIDTKGDSGLSRTKAYGSAQAAVDGDHIGFMFLDMRRMLDASLEMTRSLGGTTPPIGESLLALVPDWAAFRLRIEGDALVMDGVLPHVETAPGPAENRANKVAEYAPPSTVVIAAGNEFGESLLEMVAIYRNEPTLAEAFKGIDQAAGVVGGLDAALGWMGDTGVVVAKSGDSVEGGIIAIPADAAGGRQLLTTLRSFIQLGGGQAGITVREEDHGGTTITIIDLGTLSDLAGLAGTFGAMPVPTDPGGLPDGRVEISYAATDQVVIIGSSPDFVKHALDAGAGASLADDVRYQGLVARAGAAHTSVSFIDITAVRGLVEGLLSEATPNERAEYEESIKPFLMPFDALVSTSVRAGELDQSHMLITVK